MKHFINEAMLAPNVMTVEVDRALVDEFATLVRAPDDQSFATIRPSWPSDMRWISPRTEEGFGRFDEAFRRLDIARHVRPYLDIDRDVQVYGGFIVVRSQCDATRFHVDWVKANNQAFTLLTPIGEPVSGFGLSYCRLDGEVAQYDYRPGEAIIFGDHFMHSTQPGRSEQPVALLCFNFGTDRMEDWETISTTAAYQGELVRRPDGEFERRKR